VTAAYADDPALAEVARTGRAVVAVDVERAAPGMVVTTRDAAGRAVLAALGIGPATGSRRGRALAASR